MSLHVGIDVGGRHVIILAAGTGTQLLHLVLCALLKLRIVDAKAAIQQHAPEEWRVAGRQDHSRAERDRSSHARLIAACEHTDQILYATWPAGKIERSRLAYGAGNSQTSPQEVDVRLFQ